MGCIHISVQSLHFTLLHVLFSLSGYVYTWSCGCDSHIKQTYLCQLDEQHSCGTTGSSGMGYLSQVHTSPGHVTQLGRLAHATTATLFIKLAQVSLLELRITLLPPSVDVASVSRMYHSSFMPSHPPFYQSNQHRGGYLLHFLSEERKIAHVILKHIVITNTDLICIIFS